MQQSLGCLTDAHLHSRDRTLPNHTLVCRLRARPSGAHSQGETLEELNDNLREVIALVLEDGEPDTDGDTWALRP